MSKKEFDQAKFSGSPLRSELIRRAKSVINSFVKRHNKSGDVVLDINAAGNIARQLGDWLNDKLLGMTEIEVERTQQQIEHLVCDALRKQCGSNLEIINLVMYTLKDKQDQEKFWHPKGAK